MLQNWESFKKTIINNAISTINIFKINFFVHFPFLKLLINFYFI